MKVVVWMTTKQLDRETWDLLWFQSVSSNHNNGLKHANFQLCMFDLTEF